MMVVHRASDSFAGVDINSVGFSGRVCNVISLCICPYSTCRSQLFVKSEEMLARVKDVGPMVILQGVAAPID